MYTYISSLNLDFYIQTIRIQAAREKYIHAHPVQAPILKVQIDAHCVYRSVADGVIVCPFPPFLLSSLSLQPPLDLIT